jgi:hypothetical protein
VGDCFQYGNETSGLMKCEQLSECQVLNNCVHAGSWLKSVPYFTMKMH